MVSFRQLAARRSLLVRISAALLAVALGVSGCGGGGGGGDVVTPPTPTAISTQPASLGVVSGAGANFSVTATGDALRYQWQTSTDAGANWADIAGATTATHLVAAAQPSQSGNQFRVQVSGAAGSVLSSAATLTVSTASPLQIVTQPADQTVVAGNGTSFSVTVNGTSPSYRWQTSGDGNTWSDIPGNDSATLPVATTLAGGAQQRFFRVVVSNALGNVTSQAARLTVTAVSAAPTITQQPTGASVVAPTAVSFSVVANGTPAPQFQWQVSTDNGSVWGDITGATSATYTIASTSTADSGKAFRSRVFNSAGSVFSSAVVLSVSGAGITPSFGQQPLSQSVTAPAAATFTVTVNGSPTPSLQWQLSSDGGATFSNINGATASSYTTPATAAADSGRHYRIVASNAAGSATSTAANLIVVAAPAGKAFVYTAHRSSNAIGGYAVDRGTGALTDIPGGPFTVTGATGASMGLQIHPNGRFLYAAEAGRPRTWVYAIDTDTGGLTLTGGSPFTTATLPIGAPVFSPTGGHLIYPAPFQPASYAVDASTGALTPTGSLTFSIASDAIEFSADGQFVFLQDGSSNLRVLRIAPFTLLSDAGTSVAIKTGSAFRVRGGYLFAQPRGSGAGSYTVGAAGTLSPVQTLTGLGPNLVAHPSGRCFYMSGEVGGNPPTQSISFTPVTLDPTTGAIAAKTAVRVTVPGSIIRTSYALQMNPTGDYGYLSTLDGTLFGPVTPVALDGSSCGLAAGASFDPGPLALNLAFDRAGSLQFNYGASAASLFVSIVDPVTRIPRQVLGSPFPIAGQPLQVVVR